MKSGRLTGLVKGSVKWGLGSAALAVVVAWSAGSFERKQAPGKVDALPGVPLPAGAPTLAVKAEPMPLRVDVVGTVQSVETVRLSARLSAYVREVLVTAGSAVRKGQTLLLLDDRELQEQLKAARIQLQQAETEFNRTRKLMDTGAATDQALTAARSAFDGAQAQVRQVEVMLTFTEIKAPIDGVVTDRRVEAGDLANPGQILLSVYDPTKLRVEAPTPLRLIDKLPLGQAVTVELERPARTTKGTVSQIVAEVDPHSRTQMVKVQLDAADATVLPGTFARVWVEESVRPALLVPAAALRRVGQLESVQVVRNGRAVWRMVRTGRAHGDRIEILAGLEDGETVVVPPVMP